MQIAEYDAGDTRSVAEVADLLSAVAKVDSPWVHPETPTTVAGRLRHGWDGEPPRAFVGRIGDRLVAACDMWCSNWDNTHLAWLWLSVHPDARRRGLGSQTLEHMTEEARRMGRRSLGIDGWESAGTLAFAARHGLQRKSVEVNRRLHLAELASDEVERLYREAAAAGAAYELIRIQGRTPDPMLDAVAAMTAAINDAPTDDLDIEDEVFPRERIQAYEEATLGRGNRLYRVLARHRQTGELAGHTVVAVEVERPEIGDQHDTSVVRAHRGHRLGLLLKAEMLRWLADAEPGLRTIDTWNAESNRHMVAVNEQLGYRVMGRELAFQRDI